VPTNGDSGLVALDVAAHAGANTAHATANLNMLNEVDIVILDGTGAFGAHPFPPSMTIKLGTMLRFIDQDSTTPHRIHSNGGTGFPHQASDMFQGQEYDVTPGDTATVYYFYCHDHGETVGNTHLTVE